MPRKGYDLMKSKSLRSYVAGFLSAVLLLALATSAMAAYQKQATLDYSGIQITLNGNKIDPVDANGNPVEPFAISGTTYLPVRAISNALGLGVEWEPATQTVKLTSGNTPVAPTTPTGSFSRLSPAPIGTAQSIQVENILEKYNASVVVLESVRGAAAWEMVKAANMFNSEPEAGKEYIVVKVRVSINSVSEDKAISLSEYSFDTYSSDNVEYDRAFVVDPSPTFSGNVFAGGTLEGYFTVQVNVSDPSPKLVFGAKYDGSGGIWFSLV